MSVDERNKKKENKYGTMAVFMCVVLGYCVLCLFILFSFYMHSVKQSVSIHIYTENTSTATSVGFQVVNLAIVVCSWKYIFACLYISSVCVRCIQPPVKCVLTSLQTRNRMYCNVALQDPYTRCLVFRVLLCRWFNTETFQLCTGISKFYVTCWMDKTWQAGSWALVASDTPRWCYSVSYFYLITNIFSGLTDSRKS